MLLTNFPGSYTPSYETVGNTLGKSYPPFDFESTTSTEKTVTSDICLYSHIRQQGNPGLGKGGWTGV